MVAVTVGIAFGEDAGVSDEIQLYLGLHRNRRNTFCAVPPLDLSGLLFPLLSTTFFHPLLSKQIFSAKL